MPVIEKVSLSSSTIFSHQGRLMNVVQNMGNSALQALPPEWQHWIAENVARSCDPNEMANLLVRDGHFDVKLAQAAIAEASNGHIALPAVTLEMPEIDTRANAIHTSDRVVDVLLTLASPRIVLLGNVLSDEECDAMAAYCEPRLMRSSVVNDADGSMQTHQNRTSSGAMIQRAETELIERVEARLAELAHWPVERGEGMQIQHYEATNEYRPHFDWFDPELPGPRKHMEHGGQRLGTFVLYLSDVEQGGGTAFPAIGLEVLPKKGGAVFFQNTDSQHRPNRHTLHAGSPVVRGVKVIANKWLRERTY
jgi:prolyl 4-hydroxylase